jgi:hypothetical protein
VYEGKFMLSPHTKPHMFISSCFLPIAIKPKAKRYFRSQTIILQSQKKDCFNKNCRFFPKQLLIYVSLQHCIGWRWRMRHIVITDCKKFGRMA